MIRLREKSVTMDVKVGEASLQCRDCDMLLYLPVSVCKTCLSVFYSEMGGYLLLADHQVAMFDHGYVI